MNARVVKWVRGKGITPQEAVYALPLDNALVQLVGGISHPQGRLDVTAYATRGQTGVVGTSHIPGLRAELHVLGWTDGDPYPEATMKLFTVPD